MSSERLLAIARDAYYHPNSAWQLSFLGGYKFQTQPDVLNLKDQILMRFGIDMGHNCPPHDTGASGIQQEDVLTKDVGTRLSAKLAAAGHTVVNCTPSSATSVGHSLRQRVDKTNSNNVDIFVSIHFNAFKSTDKPMGSEVFAISNASRVIAVGRQCHRLIQLLRRIGDVFHKLLFWGIINCI
jgi:N-acetylmuramoyl-L-alanine amidase